LILVISSFAVQKLYNMIQSHLSILVLISWAIGVLFKRHYLCLFFQAYFPVLFSNSFKVSGLIFRSLIYFELIFVQARWVSSLSVLHVNNQFFLIPFVEEAFFSLTFLVPLIVFIIEVFYILC
jgi:hypothetical protein